jgi:polyphosphate kinase 2 (PPK2 family)
MKEFLDTSKYLVKEGEKIALKDFSTSYNGTKFTKEQGEILLQNSLQQLASLQDKLYASGKYSMLVVLQAMDAAGKDSTVKHLMSGFNPSGVKVSNFKEPSSTELAHDYLWRHYKELPRRGEIGIFNRSHYENVLVTRIHPELVLKENPPV